MYNTNHTGVASYSGEHHYRNWLFMVEFDNLVFLSSLLLGNGCTLPSGLVRISNKNMAGGWRQKETMGGGVGEEIKIIIWKGGSAKFSITPPS